MFNNVSSELNNLFSKLNQVSPDNFGSKSNKNFDKDFVNSIFAVGGSAAALAQGTNNEEKAQIVNQLVNIAMSIFEKIAGNEAKQAKNEVKKQTSKTQKLAEKSKELTVELDGKFNKVAKSIDKQNKIVERANELLIETQKSIEEKQEKIQKFVDEIAKKQEELKSAKTSEEQARILGEIKGLAGQIAQIGLTIEEDNENLQNLTNAVENTVDNIENATAEMEVIEQDGIAKIQQNAQEAAQAETDIAQTGAKGTINKATGETAQKAAEAASSNVISGSTIAPQLYKTANDQNQASQTRLISIQGNINRVAQGIGGLNNATDIIASFQTSIGNALGNFASLVGQWDTAVEPVIIGIGSFADVAKATEELNQSVKTDLGTLGYELDTEGDIQKAETTDNKEDKKPEEKEINSEELQTPKFDINKLKAFGI